ncbi:MAG: toprim domain-containing protein [Schwartzia sp.]|nr:toprim domain-containing protein [Schwartzia sp. (in: firmicutes)]
MALYNRFFLESLAARLGEYLEMTGRTTKKNFACASPKHEDKNPSMHFYGTTCFCFSCGARYDLFRFIAVDYGISNFRGQVEKACEIFRVSAKEAENMTQEIRDRETARRAFSREKPKELRDYGKFFAYCHARICDTDYWKRRGLSPEIVKKAGLGYHPQFRVSRDGEAWPVLIIPTDKYHFVARNTDPEADKNSRFHASQGGRVLYTRFSDIEHSTNPTWIVEGEIDALSIADAGGEAIALGSTQNVPKLLKYLSEHRPKTPLILSLDRDSAGREAQGELARKLSEMKIPYYHARAIPYNDANEFLQSESETFHQYVKNSNSYFAKLAHGRGR